MTTGGLKKFAIMMRRYAIEHPRANSSEPIEPYRVKLSGGLRIVLYLDLYHTWHLSMYRQGVEPAQEEIKAVRRDFAVPAEAEISRRVIGGEWHTVDLTWPESPDQRPLFDVQPRPDEPSYYHFECGE